jgi:hypothetical protein
MFRRCMYLCTLLNICHTGRISNRRYRSLQGLYSALLLSTVPFPLGLMRHCDFRMFPSFFIPNKQKFKIHQSFIFEFVRTNILI